MSVRPQPPNEDDLAMSGHGEYAQPDIMLHGLPSQHVKNNAVSAMHTLEYTEKHWLENQEKRDMEMLKTFEGKAGPLKLQMERKIASMENRLSCLPSSNLMYDTLTGYDEDIGLSDIFNNDFEREYNVKAHLSFEAQSIVKS